VTDDARPASIPRIAFEDLLPEGSTSVRKVLYEQPYALLPRDPSVSVNVYVGIIKAGATNAYHFHNGTSFFAVIQGRIRIEFQDEVREYEAGDVYCEPIGKVHRAENPDADVDFVCIGFNVTAPDREMVVNLAGDDPPW
jgi:quercetin dioxygenase-like cupin family protein